ncbi:hypothetical protein EMCRGX_G012233 [Ephydatia muelleri]
MTPSSPPLCVWTKGGAGLSCCGCIGDSKGTSPHCNLNEDKYRYACINLFRHVPQASDHTPCIAPELCLHVLHQFPSSSMPPSSVTPFYCCTCLCTASTQGNTSVVSPTMHVETTVTAEKSKW